MFDGVWRGLYNSQPTVAVPNVTYPENVNEYELRLHDRNGAVTGEFRHRSNTSGVALVNGKRFGDRACFDIVEDGEDMRWCVAVHGKRLTGE